MSGRLENEIKINKAIDKRLEDMPIYVKQWDNMLRAEGKTAATRNDFIMKVCRFIHFINNNPIDMDANEITLDNISRYFISIQTKEKNGITTYTSDSYKQGIWFCLNNFISFLYSNGYIKENYMKKIKKSKNRDLNRINQNRILLTGNDFNNILSCIRKENNEILRKRDLAIILLFMNTGIRKTALEEIDIDDINFESGVLTVIDKGDKYQEFPLNKDVLFAITNWLNVREKVRGLGSTKALFVSYSGERLGGRGIYKVVQKYSDMGLGYRISPHKLRAGLVSILYEKEHNIEKVRRAIGHANVATTQRYIVTDNTERIQMAQTMDGILNLEY